MVRHLRCGLNLFRGAADRLPEVGALSIMWMLGICATVLGVLMLGLSL